MDVNCLAGLIIIGAFAMLMLRLDGLLKSKTNVVAAMALLFLALAVRGACLSYETTDYQNFLTKWVAYFAENGAWKGLGQNVGNYNVPYLYFLSLFSLSKVKDLYLIKLLSIFFDIVLALGAEKCLGIFKRSHSLRLACFLTVLFLPTVVLNGALWGQCDSIYSSFAVWALYFALREKGVPSMICAALSFAFKLQAVFFLPVYLLVFIQKKVKIWHFLLFPITYVICVLPAVFAGRPFADTILLYFKQAGTVGGGLNYNSSSVFAMIKTDNTEAASRIGIAAAFLLILLLAVLFFCKRKEWGNLQLYIGAFILCAGIPFLLPHMHDRYFFLADILSTVFAFILPAVLPVPFLTSFASLLGYYAFLHMRYLMPMRYGSYCLILVLIASFAALILTGMKPSRAKERIEN